MNGPGARTRLTELMTALGTLGDGDFRSRLPARPPEFRGVSDEDWNAVCSIWDDEALAPLADAAWDNGRFFLGATDALRGRRPRLVEWAGPRRPPGDEVAPVDLRIDHVFLVSCKYLSKITMNASPAYLFDRLLTGRQGRRSGDWFHTVAPDAHRRLWRASHAHLRRLLDHDVEPAPAEVDAELLAHDGDPTGLSAAARRRTARLLRGRSWPVELRDDYERLCGAAAATSAQRWNDAIEAAGPSAAEAMVWRLLRIGSAPYFVLGAHADARPVRLRVASPWDWRRDFEFRSLDVAPIDAGQATVGWQARLIERESGRPREINGHVEVRWSHGRFSGPPEAKVYLDTPFTEVPGYWPLT